MVVYFQLNMCKYLLQIVIKKCPAGNQHVYVYKMESQGFENHKIIQ